MINLSCIFEDSIDSLDNGSDVLQIKSLPVSVLMMQKDVINHYRYAIEHYFDLTLKESYLQNSSLGSPYEKWRKFTNDDFDLLFFSIKTLITYSSRLFHESELKQRIENDDFKTLKMDSNRYTNIICDFKYKKSVLGIDVNEDESLDIHEYVPDGMFVDENWHSVKTTKVDISNRKVLKDIVKKANLEIGLLADLHSRYTVRCQKFSENYDVFQNYENIHQSYWV
ncbi:MAG: hypothetical protein ACI86C_001544 [Candidatus Latescibacterota bacterium]|jgi:hypothetical protein